MREVAALPGYDPSGQSRVQAHNMVDISVEQMTARVQVGFVIGKKPVRRAGLKISGVYAIFNVISGRLYVGSSQYIGQRWHAHFSALIKRKHHSRTLQRSWGKHGPETFSWEVIETVPLHANLFIREQHWIDAMAAFHPTAGFNLHPRAGGPRGHKMSEATRQKMSQSRIGRKMPPMTQERREFFRKRLLGVPRSPSSIAKQVATITGVKKGPFTEAHRAALKLSASSRPAPTEEQNARRSKALKGRVFTEEHRKKISQGRLASWAVWHSLQSAQMGPLLPLFDETE